VINLVCALQRTDDSKSRTGLGIYQGKTVKNYRTMRSDVTNAYYTHYIYFLSRFKADVA